MGSRFKTVGFDLNTTRVAELSQGIDRTGEVESDVLSCCDNLLFSSDPSCLANGDIYIVAVPTPVDQTCQPDLSMLKNACKQVATVLSLGNTVVFESTVYPGVTDEICVPILEDESGLKVNADFFVGYSPERVNPGDKTRRLSDIVKVVSGSTPETMNLLESLYSSIVHAGVYVAPSIKVAEAAKVIENTQRDVNIALINEISMILSLLGIDTEAVLKAAGTKWNFLPFRPGLVGGHCIGVDPYYLTYKAKQVGYDPRVILSGRNVNDAMGSVAANKLLSAMEDRSINCQGAKILIMGLTFKENCPDLRNSKVTDLLTTLKEAGCKTDIYDPVMDQYDDSIVFNSDVIDFPRNNYYDAIIVAVSHDNFRSMGSARIRQFGNSKHILFDLKYIFSEKESDLRL